MVQLNPPPPKQVKHRAHALIQHTAQNANW